MIATKLHIPYISLIIVTRPGLIDKLNKGLNQNLLLVSAPAGYGKTTGAKQRIVTTEVPAAWYPTDNRDIMDCFHIQKSSL